jgi:hypothetical protein
VIAIVNGTEKPGDEPGFLHEGVLC